MKNKIRRAFDATKPNVLSRVLEDCSDPAPEVPAAPQKKRKLSERTMQFIATAASIAILIGAVSGGFVYYRNQFSRPDGSDGSTGSFWSLFSPGQAEPGVDVDPLPTVDYDWSEDGLIDRARQIIDPDVAWLQISESQSPATIDLMDGKYIVTQLYDAFVYTISFGAANGALLDIQATCVTGFTYDITESVAAWIALLDLDPAHYSLTQYAQYEVSLQIAKVDYVDRPGGLENYYAVQINHGGANYLYYIDPLTGEILSSGQVITTDPLDPISIEEAQKIVTEAMLAEREDCYIVSSEDCGDCYRIRVCCTDDPITADAYRALICFEYYVNCVSGKIVACDKGLSQWSEEIAAEVAKAYLGNVDILDCTYILRSGLYSFYQVTLDIVTPGGNENTRLQIYEIYSEGYDVPPEIYDGTELFTVRDLALEMQGVVLGDVRFLSISDEGEYYSVRYQWENSDVEFFIDATGEVYYDSGVRENILQEADGLIGWQAARDLCLEACGRSLEELIFFGYEYRSEGCYNVEMGFVDDSFVWFVDGQTGDFLEEPEVDILPPVVDGMITYEQALEIAAIHADCLEEAIAGTLTDLVTMLDLDNCSYWFAFDNGNIRWSITIDAYTGEVLQALSADTTVPDDKIVEDIVIRLAADYAGCLADYEAGTLADVAVKFDEDKCVYWVYFCHDGFYWEMEVDAGAGEVLGVQCWEADIDSCIEDEYKLEFGDQAVLLMVVPGKVTNYTLLNAETGTCIDSTDPIPPGSRSKEEAMQTCAEQLGLNTYTSGSVALLGLLENELYFYCVVIPMEDFSYVALMDAGTGEILCQTTIS